MKIEDDMSVAAALPGLVVGPPLDRSPFSPGSLLKEAQESFASVLGRAQGSAAAAPMSDAQRAREAAEQLVTQTFVAPMLKQLRETNQAAAPFAPTQAEKQFRALTDADLAQRIVRAARFPLVDRLAQDLLKRAGKDHLGRVAANELATGASQGAASSIPRTTGVGGYGGR
jgi:Rod binding domain-containing protein